MKMTDFEPLASTAVRQLGGQICAVQIPSSSANDNNAIGRICESARKNRRNLQPKNLGISYTICCPSEGQMPLFAPRAQTRH